MIGAEKGLKGEPTRTSYFCIGMKGLRRGMAIEKAGFEELRYAGPDVGSGCAAGALRGVNRTSAVVGL